MEESTDPEELVRRAVRVTDPLYFLQYSQPYVASLSLPARLLGSSLVEIFEVNFWVVAWRYVNLNLCKRVCVIKVMLSAFLSLHAG